MARCRGGPHSGGCRCERADTAPGAPFRPDGVAVGADVLRIRSRCEDCSQARGLRFRPGVPPGAEAAAQPRLRLLPEQPDRRSLGRGAHRDGRPPGPAGRRPRLCLPLRQRAGRGDRNGGSQRLAALFSQQGARAHGCSRCLPDCAADGESHSGGGAELGDRPGCRGDARGEHGACRPRMARGLDSATVALAGRAGRRAAAAAVAGSGKPGHVPVGRGR